MRSFTNNNVFKSESVKMLHPKFLESMPLTAFETTSKDTLADPQSLLAVRDKETQILNAAAVKGQALVADAQKKAAEIIQAAQNEKEAIRKKISLEIEDELRSKIIPKTRAKAYQEGLAAGKEAAVEMKLRAKQYLDYAQNALAFELKRVDQDLLNLSIRIGEKIVGTSLEITPELLLPIIHKLVIAAGKKDDLKICVAEEDFVWLKDLPKHLKPLYPIVVDPSLKAGDTYLETKGGLYSGLIESQLAEIGEALYEGLENDQLAAVGAGS